jgi:hypothetical protein
MTNSQTMQKNGKLDVIIYLLELPYWSQVYEGFQSTLSKHFDENVAITSVSFEDLRPNLIADFVIILTTP